MTFIENTLREMFTNLERVALEDSRFEEVFEVYSDDQVAARMRLTPKMMERLLAISSMLGAQRFCFYDRFLFILAPSSPGGGDGLNLLPYQKAH